MRCRHTDLVSFWLMPWSAPFRDACVWVTLLGASARIAQIYAELKRRHKAMRARALLREQLRVFVTWQAPREAATASDASEPEAALAGAACHSVPAGG